jgi:hypothetical protein
MLSSPTLLRTGAVCFVLGLVMVVVTTALHPYQNDPSDSPAAFREYAESATWIDVHTGQFFAVLILVAGFLCLSPSLRVGAGWSPIFAWLGLMAAVLTLATFAALQAVDGVSLKFVVDRWVTAPPAEQPTAFRIAEAVRWIEIGLNSYFRILVGVTLALYGASLAAGSSYPRWLGWLAIVAGLGSIWHGVAVGHWGFSAVSGNVGLLPTLLYFVWFLVMGAVMWRTARTTEPVSRPTGVPTSG